MTRTLIDPQELFDGRAFGMAQGIVTTAGRHLFLSGQVDWGKDFSTSEDTVAGQLGVALENVRIALEAAGSAVEHLVHLRIYIRGEVGEHTAAASPVLAAFLGETRVAMTMIGVASLAAPSLLVEVEAVAAVP